MNRTDRKLVGFIVLLFALNCVVLSGCLTDSDNEVVGEKEELVIGTLRESTGFYPWMQVRDAPTLTINVNMFNSLIQIDQHDLGFISALAENWLNPDNVTWRFFLREDVKFHNGYGFSAVDVKFTLDFVRNFSYFAEELRSISEIEIVDNYTVDIRTERPYPNLLNKLLTVYMVSKQYIVETGFSNDTWPVGTGAYKLVEEIPGKHIVLECFDEYWRETPDVKKVIFKVMNSSAELKNALKAGGVDIVSLSLDFVDEISDTTGLEVASVQPPSVVYLGFDFRVNDSVGFPGVKNPVSDVRVRKAMYHAINISAIIEKFFNDVAEPASQFITYHILVFNPDIKRLPYDVELAKQYMRDAGYQHGFDIIFDAPLSSLAVNLSNEIVEQLAKINISVTPRFLSSTEYYMNLYLKNTSFYITSFNAYDAESTLGLLLQTSDMDNDVGVWNYGNYSNAEVDELIVNISYIMEPGKRKKMIQDAFLIAADDVAWIPLYSTKVFYGMQDFIRWNPRPSLFIWVEEIQLV